VRALGEQQRSRILFVSTIAATWSTTNGRARWNDESLGHWSDVLAAELGQIFEPIEVWLFGSVARGDDDGDSDLDVLVVLDQYDANNVIALKRQAIRATSIPAPFDISFSDPGRMAQRCEIAGTIERAVRLDGVLKYRRG
jgi:hypothetical protein